jgi:hypothetical protein
MSHDTRFPTSDDWEPLHYISFIEEVQTTLNRELSLDMLASASEYSTAIAEVLEERVFPETVPATTQVVPAKHYVDELRSNEGRVIFNEGFLLDIELSKENSLFFFQNIRFNIFGHGPTKEEALKDFSEFFVHDYLSYKNTPPNNLTRDACQLLKEYESVIAQFESL